mgnify:CR=1 FL=1
MLGLFGEEQEKLLGTIKFPFPKAGTIAKTIWVSFTFRV